MTSRYHTIFNLIALSIVIYLGVGVFYKIVGARLRHVDTKTIVVKDVTNEKGQQKRSQNDYQLIIDRNIFGSTDKTHGEVNTEEIEALEPTSLKVTLLGTVSGNPQNSVAVIEETVKRKQGLFKVGDSIQNAIIKMILRGKVILRVDDRDEILTMEESEEKRSERGPRASRTPESGTTITVRRSDIEESLKDINKLMSQVRIRPHFKAGKPDGLSLSNVVRSSIFGKLGLRNGDIIQGVNNSSIQSPDDIMELYSKLKSGSAVALQIDRRGQRQTLNYRFK